MITKVEVRTAQGGLLTLSLEDVISGIIVKDIGGIDPVKASIASSSFASMDGVQYQSSRLEARNITFTLDLEPDYITQSVRDLRNRLYGFFMPKSQVNLRFYMSDGLTVSIDGRVEDFSSPPFTKEPKVDISVMCFDPDFIESTERVLFGVTVSNTDETLVTYPGSVDTGIKFVLSVNRNLSSFAIYNRLPDNTIKTLNFNASLLAGDILTISTVPGSKYATRTRSGVDVSLLYGVTPQSDWIQFSPGDNHFRVYAAGAAVSYGVVYTPRYGGL